MLYAGWYLFNGAYGCYDSAGEWHFAGDGAQPIKAPLEAAAEPAAEASAPAPAVRPKWQSTVKRVWAKKPKPPKAEPAPEPEPEPAAAAVIVEQMTIPGAKCAAVVGPGSGTLQAIEAASGAKLVVTAPPKAAPPSERPVEAAKKPAAAAAAAAAPTGAVQLTGTAVQIAKARELVEEICAKGKLSGAKAKYDSVPLQALQAPGARAEAAPAAAAAAAAAGNGLLHEPVFSKLGATDGRGVKRPKDLQYDWRPDPARRRW